jgi:hypothetical protein
MSWVGTAIGLGVVGGAGGAAMQASSASAARRQARDAANLPGVNIGQVLGESSQNAPRAREMEAERNAFNRAQLLESLGIQVPGYQEAQAKRAENALALLRGELPPDVLAQVQRKAAGQAVQGGYAGSAAGRNLVARDIGRTSLDLANLGGQQFANILGTTPLAPLANYEFTPQQIAALRGGERSAQQQALLGVAGMPSATGIAGQALGSLGSGLTNLGFAQLGAQYRGGGGGGAESDLVSTQRKLMGG